MFTVGTNNALDVGQLKAILDAVATSLKLANEIEKLLKRLPPNASRSVVVIDARLTNLDVLSVYSMDVLSKKFEGWVVKPLVGIDVDYEDEIIELLEEKYAELGSDEEVVFATQQSIGISLLRAFVDEKFVKMIRDGEAAEYVGTFKTSCEEAERIIGELALIGADLHTGIELTIGGLRRYLPFKAMLLRRKLDEVCRGREKYGMADYIRRHGKLYVVLSHTCSLYLPHVLERLGLCS